MQLPVCEGVRYAEHCAAACSERVCNYAMQCAVAAGVRYAVVPGPRYGVTRSMGMQYTVASIMQCYCSVHAAIQ
jgi:hypothetical protein